MSYLKNLCYNNWILKHFSCWMQSNWQFSRELWEGNSIKYQYNWYFGLNVMQFEVFCSFFSFFLINVYVLSDDGVVVLAAFCWLDACALCYIWTLMFVAWNQFENESIYNLLIKVFMIFFVLYSDRSLTLDCNKKHWKLFHGRRQARFILKVWT